jgi:toxin ParE1/3/4
VVRAIYDAASALLAFPSRGRPGRKEGTRELVLSPLPYIVICTVRDDIVFVIRILHGAQDRP